MRTAFQLTGHALCAAGRATPTTAWASGTQPTRHRWIASACRGRGQKARGLTRAERISNPRRRSVLSSLMGSTPVVGGPSTRVPLHVRSDVPHTTGAWAGDRSAHTKWLHVPLPSPVTGPWPAASAAWLTGRARRGMQSGRRRHSCIGMPIPLEGRRRTRWAYLDGHPPSRSVRRPGLPSRPGHARRRDDGVRRSEGRGCRCGGRCAARRPGSG